LRAPSFLSSAKYLSASSFPTFFHFYHFENSRNLSPQKASSKDLSKAKANPIEFSFHFSHLYLILCCVNNHINFSSPHHPHFILSSLSHWVLPCKFPIPSQWIIWQNAVKKFQDLHWETTWTREGSVRIFLIIFSADHDNF
jgi:hypothetical protein